MSPYTNAAFARFTECDVGPDETGRILEPDSDFWKDAPSIAATNDAYGIPVAGLRTEIYVQWSRTRLYFLFVCRYEELHLKPSPKKTAKTQELWNWDVAEVFIGSDFERIGRYKEFQVSPQGEWLDIEVDLDNIDEPKGWSWNSGLQAAARIAADEQTWYGFLSIPYSSVDKRPARLGNRLRFNFFRSQGPPEAYREIAWQPCYETSFHVPQSFGILELSASHPEKTESQ